jgi:hypothetical protein
VASEPRAPLGHGGSVQLNLTAATPAADSGTFQVNGQPCLAVSFPFAGPPSPTPAVPVVPDPALASRAQLADASNTRPKATRPPHPSAANGNNNGKGASGDNPQ